MVHFLLMRLKILSGVTKMALDTMSHIETHVALCP